MYLKGIKTGAAYLISNSEKNQLIYAGITDQEATTLQDMVLKRFQ
jgi:hypothetical protein